MGRDFILVTNADVGDYLTSLDWYGYSVDDFELSEAVDESSAYEVQPMSGFVKVSHTPSKVVRHYQAGVRWRWTEDFDRDLRNNVFSRQAKARFWVRRF